MTGHSRAGDRRTPRGLAPSYPRHELSVQATSGGVGMIGWLPLPPITSPCCPPIGSMRLSDVSSGLGLGSGLVGHEPHRARPIRRGGRVRSRGDSARRTDAACVHHRLCPLGRRHAPSPRGNSAQARPRIEGLVAVARTGNLILHLPGRSPPLRGRWHSSARRARR